MAGLRLLAARKPPIDVRSTLLASFCFARRFRVRECSRRAFSCFEKFWTFFFVTVIRELSSTVRRSFDERASCVTPRRCTLLCAIGRRRADDLCWRERRQNDVREATHDGRVRKTLCCDARRRGAPAQVSNVAWSDYIQRLGHCRPREIRRSSRWLLVRVAHRAAKKLSSQKSDRF